MDYNIKNFTLRVHIDWIRFALLLPTGDQIERTEHDIRSPADLNNRIAALMKKHHPTEIVPVGLEFALDAKHESDDNAVLAELAAIMWRMNTPDISTNKRIYRTRGTATAIPSHERLIAKLLAGWQLAEGNTWDTVYRHGYMKTSDDNNRQACRPCARLEIRLQGEDCPFSTLEELRTFDWTRLREWFRFRRLKDDISGIERIVTQASEDIGKKRARKRANEGGTRMFSRITLADAGLRDRAYDALRTLNKRWRRASRIICHSHTYTTIDREKVGIFGPEARAVTGSARITTIGVDNNLPNFPTTTTTPNPEHHHRPLARSAGRPRPRP